MNTNISIEDSIEVGSKVWVPDFSSDTCKIVKATVLSFEIIFGGDDLSKLEYKYKVRAKIDGGDIEDSYTFDEIALTKKEATKKYHINFAKLMLHSRKFFLDQRVNLQNQIVILKKDLDITKKDLSLTKEVLSAYSKEIKDYLRCAGKSNIEIKKIMAAGVLEDAAK